LYWVVEEEVEVVAVGVVELEFDVGQRNLDRAAVALAPLLQPLC
jgi:hypothetical protein